MLVSTRVIELNKQVKEEKAKRYSECTMISRKLDPVNKLRLKRINTLINRISMGIEDTTGWIYTPSGFTFKSNYQYDEEHDEITFDLNKVIRTRTGYKISDLYTDPEKEFVSKHRELLDRLLKLEQKRDKLLNPYLRKYGELMSYFEELTSKKYRDTTESKCKYIEIASQQFESKFGKEGIKRLLNLLNYLVETSYTEPLDNYNDQFIGSITSDYVDELFRWAATFTPRAGYILDVVSKKREEEERKTMPELSKITLQ